MEDPVLVLEGRAPDARRQRGRVDILHGISLTVRAAKPSR
jgi:hypothetical protein